MAFGSPRRLDPRDQLIETLRDEILYLRAQLDEANRTNLALMNSYAYRQRYGNPPNPEAQAAPPDPDAGLGPSQLRSRTVIPDFTIGSIERQFIEQGSMQAGEKKN